MNGKPHDEIEVQVTESEINLAWERLYAQISRENVPEGWLPRGNQEVKRQAPDETADPSGAPEEFPVPAKRAADPIPRSSRSAAATNSSEGVSDGIGDPIATAKGTAGEPGLGRSAALRRSRGARLLGRLTPVAAAALVAGLLLFSSWGQDVMAAMMSTFRVQQMASVSLDADDLQQLAQDIGAASSGAQHLDLKQYGDVEQTVSGTPRTLSLQEASSAAGKSLKTLPGADKAAVRFLPQRTVVFKLHTKPVNTLIALLGGKTTFPKSVDGQPIRLTIPGSYVMTAGSSGTSGESASQKQLVQLPAPTLDVPSGVDLDRIREAVLDIPLLPADLRSQLAAIGDWQHTLPVPNVTTPDGDTIRSVSVSGSDAAIAQSDGERLLVWLADGWIYRLSGSTSDYPTDGDIIADAERLMRG